MKSQVTQPGSASHNMLKGGRSSRRAFKDKAAQIGITIGGTMVFVALLLIFFYLLYVIKPIFDSADATPVNSVRYQHTDVATLMVGADEQNEVLYRVAVDGQVDFYAAADGSLMSTFTPPLPAGVTVTSAAVAAPNEQRFALGLSNGQALIVGIEFGLTYPNNKRLITPKLRYSSGDTPITIDDNGSAINKLAFINSSDKLTFVYQDASGVWRLSRVEGEENMMTEEVEWTLSSAVIADAPKNVAHQLMTPDHRQLMLQMDNKIFIYNIRDVDNVGLLQVIDAEKDNSKVNKMTLLAGASSILVSYDSGVVTQYFQVNGHKGRLYKEIREFNNLAPVAAIATEFYRKSFAVVSPEGELSLLYTTSERELFEQKFEIKNPGVMGFSPRSNGIVVEADNQLNLFAIENAHPEVSWSALWTKVWYEGYPEPQYVWQSTSGSDDFEAKLSLMPLVFGTLKAAFYAMLFAVPLSIAGAIYTAYFMSPKVRGIVKPTIEIMEALPTVILGFLAGLWLAPLVEEHLPGILVLLVLLPVSILASAFGWSRLPGKWKQRLPE
ncbi:phosphate ABC transporter permease, partial [Shewanella sp.]|uniref:phosphate ABC transporter permease n=1 Tax=Shewanella sp. TaxID=50422 RepID=UPI003F2AF1F2